MKLTASQLRRIIKEEIEASLAETPGFLGRIMGGSKAPTPAAPNAADYGPIAKEVAAAYASGDRKKVYTAVDNLEEYFEGAVARGTDPKVEAKTLRAVLKRAGMDDEAIDDVVDDMLYRERNRALVNAKDDERREMEAAIKGLVADPESKAQLIALLTKKRDSKGNAKKAASAAVSSFLGDKIPEFDGAALHGTLSRLYGL